MIGVNAKRYLSRLARAAKIFFGINTPLRCQSDKAAEMNDNDVLIKELVCNHLPGLVLFAKQWNGDAAEDIVQEAFIKLMRQKVLPDNPAAWLFTVVRNDANNYVRSLKRRKNRELVSQSHKPVWFEKTLEYDEVNDTDRLVQELESLELEYREIIAAKIWGGLSFEKIAEMLGSSSSSVHRKFQEGLNRLEEKLNSANRSKIK
jgi:RNA polymerase sigma-70 factor (ECF subfamily)